MSKNMWEKEKSQVVLMGKIQQTGPQSSHHDGHQQWEWCLIWLGSLERSRRKTRLHGCLELVVSTTTVLHGRRFKTRSAKRFFFELEIWFLHVQHLCYSFFIFFISVHDCAAKWPTPPPNDTKLLVTLALNTRIVHVCHKSQVSVSPKRTLGQSAVSCKQVCGLKWPFLKKIHWVIFYISWDVEYAIPCRID